MFPIQISWPRWKDVWSHVKKQTRIYFAFRGTRVDRLHADSGTIPINQNYTLYIARDGSCPGGLTLDVKKFVDQGLLKPVIPGVSLLLKNRPAPRPATSTISPKFQYRQRTVLRPPVTSEEKQRFDKEIQEWFESEGLSSDDAQWFSRCLADSTVLEKSAP
jgi:hypothetical protein